jgi:hypothetical protein
MSQVSKCRSVNDKSGSFKKTDRYIFKNNSKNEGKVFPVMGRGGP